MKPDGSGETWSYKFYVSGDPKGATSAPSRPAALPPLTSLPRKATGEAPGTASRAARPAVPESRTQGPAANDHSAGSALASGARGPLPGGLIHRRFVVESDPRKPSFENPAGSYEFWQDSAASPAGRAEWVKIAPNSPEVASLRARGLRYRRVVADPLAGAPAARAAMRAGKGLRPATAHLASRFMLTPAAGGQPGLSAFDIDFGNQPENPEVSSLQYHLRLSHPHLDQITIWLMGGGREVVLWDARGGSDSGGYDDAAATGAGITLDRVLNAEFRGAQLSGHWTLYVSNADTSKAGTLDEFWVSAASLPPASPEDAPAALPDLIAQEAYLMTDPNSGSVVNYPTVGQSVYLMFDYQVSGASGYVSVPVQALIDGSQKCSGTFSDTNNFYTTWCNVAWVATSGYHTLEWDLNYTYLTSESNYNNNTATSSYSIGTSLDVVAQSAYLMTGPNSGTEVTTPSVGQSVYLLFDYQVTGASGSVNVPVRAVLDGGSPYCSSTFSDTNNSYTTWCNTPWIATAGSHTLEWDANYNYTLTESNYNNNSASDSWYTAAVDIAAETAYLMTGPNSGSEVDTPTAGQSVYLTFDYSVTGANGYLYVPVRALLDGSTYCSSSFYDTNSSYTTWCNTPWVATYGSHTLEWDANYDNSVSESNSYNNTATHSWYTSGIDIAAESAYLMTGPGTGSQVYYPTYGQSVYLTFDYSVTGVSGSINVPVRALLDGSLYCSSTFVDTNNSYTTWCNTPWAVTYGSHTLEWDANYTGSVTETNTANNTATANYYVQPPLVDLIAERAYLMTGPNSGYEVTSPTLGQSIYLMFDYSVTGASGSLNVPVRALLDGSPYCSGTFTDTNNDYTTWCNTPWIATSGGHTLEWDLNYNGSITESNPNNNTATTSFATAGLTPAAPVLVSPANGAVNVPLATALSWNAASGATSYDVYFGTSGAPPLVQSNTTFTSYSPGSLFMNMTYYWKVVAKNAYGSASSATWVFTTTGAPATSLRFVPVTPCRVADTRNGYGTFGGPTIAGGTARSFPVPQSPCGIPSSAQAYSLNVTVVPQGALYYLTLWPTGQPQPLVSTLNSWGGNILANAAIVPAGTGGAVSVFVSNTSDVILDINGYFDTSNGPSSYAFYPATPCRIVDTRNPIGQFGGPQMYGGQTRGFPIPLGSCGHPPTARAYSLNFTVVPNGPLGYLSTWPTGGVQPLVSTLNSPTGKILANAAIVPAGTNQSISVFVTNPVDVVIDSNGYFAAPGSFGALSFYPITPCRVADTRNATGQFGGPILNGGTSRSFVVPASACGVPSNAAAYSFNVTVVPSGILSYLTIWPTGSGQPYVSTLNSPDGSVVANAAIVPAGSSGAVSVFVTNPTHLVLDINGYFAP